MNGPALLWCALVLATLVSCWLGHDHGAGDADVLLTLILAIGFAKAWAVGRWFMELRAAPRVLARAFATWIVASFSIVVGLQYAI